MIAGTGGIQCQACGTWHMGAHVCHPRTVDVGRIELPPIGCICPPGANKDCERLDCPRKAVKISAGGITR